MNETPSSTSATIPTPAAPPAPTTPHESVLRHAGAVLLHALPQLGQIAGTLVSSGIHLSPQAQLAASILMLFTAFQQSQGSATAPGPIGFATGSSGPVI